MKLKLLALAAILSFGATAGLANAKGCIKGALVGGVAGHVAGHHGVAGAAAGCAVGHYRSNSKAKQDAARTNGTVTSGSPPARQQVVPAGVQPATVTPAGQVKS